MPTTAEVLVPGQNLPVDRMPGHWLLARLGKTVLRPGGRELTGRLLDALAIGPDDDVVELAPGLGSTTEMVLAANPRSYTGVDRDPVSAERVRNVVEGPGRSVVAASAADTGLGASSADVAFGEAYLTVQPDSHKRRILAEIARVLRPGGRFGLHEIALVPDDIGPAEASAVTDALTGTIKVNVSPCAVHGWRALLEEAGFVVRYESTNPLHLLEPRRLFADEGVGGALRFMGNVARHADARRRVLAMRSAMRANAVHLQAYALVAERSTGA